jgi:hypothetical protein
MSSPKNGFVTLSRLTSRHFVQSYRRPSTHWCGIKTTSCPPHCHLIRKLREFQGGQDLRAEEIARIILYDGLIAINPNEVFLPCAATIGIYTVPIARTEASRWITNAEFGANARREVAPKTVVPGRVEFEKVMTEDLGSHARDGRAHIQGVSDPIGQICRGWSRRSTPCG